MSKNLRVSVVTPVYNDPDGARKLILALREQTLEEPYEVIFVDNNSDDETPRVLRERTEGLGGFRVVEYTERQGSYAARNEGIRRARGDVLAFTDADCRPVDRWLEAGIRKLRESGAELTAGPIRVTYREEHPNLWEYLDSTIHLNQREYVEDGWGATANLFVRRDCFREHGTFRAQLQSSGDCEFGKRVTGAGGRIEFATDALVRHPARRTFLSLMKKERRIARGHRQLAEMGKRQLPELSVKDFLPALWIPGRDERELSLVQKGKVLVGANLIRWVQSWYRL